MLTSVLKVCKHLLLCYVRVQVKLWQLVLPGGPSEEALFPLATRFARVVPKARSPAGKAAKERNPSVTGLEVL